MKKLYLFLLLIFTISGLKSQNLSDAVRYSTLIPGGTARTLGAGGSFGAMGGDFGVLTINPAGLADFRSSDLTFSFSFNGGRTSSFLNPNSSGLNDKFKSNHTNEPILENVGAVFHSRPSGSSLITSNLAIGLAQYNNFRQDFTYEGFSSGSITERFAELANGRDPQFFDPFEAELAFEAGAIYDFDGDLFYETDIDTFQDVYKQQSVDRSGKTNELIIAWGGKFSNGLNIGVGIGIPFISFEENKVYRETDPENNHQLFENLTFNEKLATSGTGFNFKIGAGYTIDRKIRLGFAYQSPTYYSLDDNYENQLIYSFLDNNGVQQFESTSPSGRFEYKLSTPSRLTGSLGALINTEKIKGFINVDVQLVNYANNNFDFSGSNDPSEAAFERELNTSIENGLQSTLNYNFGGELALDKLRVRGGLGLLGSPYETDGSSNFNKLYSFGGGYRSDRFYIDLAYQIRDFEEGYVPYQVLDGSRNQFVENETNINKLIFTVGFKI